LWVWWADHWKIVRPAFDVHFIKNVDIKCLPIIVGVVVGVGELHQQVITIDNPNLNFYWHFLLKKSYIIGLMLLLSCSRDVWHELYYSSKFNECRVCDIEIQSK
jgi:hypothetical protein